MEQKPTIGRIVHYIVKSDDSDQMKSNGKRAGAILPAIVVTVWPNEFGEGIYGLNLQVFTDCGPILPKTSVKLAEGEEEGTCHWPPRV